MSNDKFVLITGGSRGIGKAIAEKFLKNAYNLIIIAKDKNRLNTVQNEFEKKYPKSKVIIISCDLACKEDIYKSVGELLKEKYKIEVVVHNAGIFLPGNLLDENDIVFEKQMKVNLFSIYYLNKILIEYLKNAENAENAHIFFISSIAALTAYENGAAYSISKHALEAYILNLRNEVKDDNISITSILPAKVWTDSWKDSGMDEDDFIPVDTIADALFNAYNTDNNTVIEQIILNNK